MGKVGPRTIGVAVLAVALALVGATALVLTGTEARVEPVPPRGIAVARPGGAVSEEGLFRLAGRVRGEDGSAIEGALVCDHPAFAAPTTCARSARDGSFALMVARGFHKLEARAPAGSRYVGAWYDARDRSRDAQILDLRSGDRSDLVVLLGAGHRVSGRVVGPTGVPVADAQACLDPHDAPAEWICVRTDVDGRYVAVVPDGQYQAFFVPPEDSRLIPRWWRSGDQVLAADPFPVHGDLPGLDMTLVPGFLIFGRVTSTSGKPAEHVLVCVDTRFPTGRICRPTDKGGNYNVSVRRGSFLMQFRSSTDSGVVTEWYGGTADPRAADDVIVSSNDVRVDAALRPGKLLWGSVRGADGRPLEGATLNVYDAQRSCCVFVTGGATGSSGDYAMIVPIGRFWIEAFPPFGQPYVSSFYGGGARRFLDVREKDTDVLADVTLENVP